MDAKIEKAYEVAREKYAQWGVDTDAALDAMLEKPLSLPCWQGDDVRGFEGLGGSGSAGGIRATGDFPGRARNGSELRADLEKAISLVPGNHRVNLHAMYGEYGSSPADRDAIEPGHYADWIDWARKRGLGLDFNATLFAHPKADGGFTLSHRDAGIRAFWIEHVQRARAVGAHMGKKQGTPCIHNLWIPDGMKDTCVDRAGYRARLKASLDAIYDGTFDPDHLKDAVESKLFGVGVEAFTVGSHEFYLGYALSRGLMVCLDLGHFHPTESVADKISSILLFSPELLLHLSRGVRWDSDHVVVLDDTLREVAQEIVRGGALERVHLALDSFDASINRVGAWVSGGRSALKALLSALLEPWEPLAALESEGDYLSRLGHLEDLKALPFGAVWDYGCMVRDVPPDGRWIGEVQQYEREVLRKRN
ncbi:MAG: L-rhamnose isomerase [Planctomycetota bacterium]|jgi:L-rhamnose isomerase